MNINQPQISRRQKNDGPNHHLWNNHGTWWLHVTFHLPDGTAKRHRTNLKTRSLAEARGKRDRLIAAFTESLPSLAA